MPFLHVTCPSCRVTCKIPTAAATQPLRCPRCKADLPLAKQPQGEVPAVNYVANFADEPPPVRYRPEPEDVETSPEPRRVRPAPPPASLRFPATVLGVAAVWLLVVVVLWFVLETPSADVATQAVAAPKAVVRVEHRPPPAGNFVEAMREFGRRNAEDNAKSGKVDWSRVGSTARADDLTFAVAETGLNFSGGVPMSMTVALRVSNASRTKIYRSEAPEDAKLIDEHGNLYKRRRYTGWRIAEDKLLPGGTATQLIFFEFPERVSTRFGLVLGKTAFELSGDVYLTFGRPTAQHMDGESRFR